MSSRPSQPGSEIVTLHLEAENRLEEIDRVNDAFEAFSDEHAIPQEVRRSLKLVFDDLLNNVISYAYPDGERHLIDVRIELRVDRVVVEISHDGEPFEHPVEPPDVSLGIEDREVGGLGVHLVKSVMDEVSYTRSGGRNVIGLMKFLPDEPNARGHS